MTHHTEVAHVEQHEMQVELRARGGANDAVRTPGTARPLTAGSPTSSGSTL